MNLPLAFGSLRRSRGYHWFVVATVCVGAFMAALDASIINIALPILKRDFHTRMHIIEWVSLSYILTLAALIVPLSRLSDMLGRKWMYSVGFSVFMVGSLLCGLSPSLRILLVARVLQAVGAGMLQANSVSIITAATPSHDRGKAIGIQASAQGIGLSLGPIVGGALITYLGWQWIFYVNIPVGILGTLLGVVILPADVKKEVREKFDILGATALIPALIALIYILNSGQVIGWTSALADINWVVITVGLTLFVIIERRLPFPLVDIQLFRSRIFTYGNLTVLVSFATLYAVMFLWPFYLDNVRGMNAFQSGIYLTAIPIGMTIITPISGAIADTVGVKKPMVVGGVLLTTGSLILAFSAHYYFAEIVIGALLLVGIGMGMFTPPNNSQVMGSVPTNRLGITGGILNMARTVGMGVGVTLGGLSYQSFLAAYGVNSENLATKHQMIYAFRDTFFEVAVLGLLIISCSLLSQRKPSAT